MLPVNSDFKIERITRWDVIYDQCQKLGDNGY